MQSLKNIQVNVVVNDRQDRTNVTGLDKLCASIFLSGTRLPSSGLGNAAPAIGRSLVIFEGRITEDRRAPAIAEPRPAAMRGHWRRHHYSVSCFACTT